jgi:hypothetical protein
MSGEPMARVPGLMPWLGDGGAMPKKLPGFDQLTNGIANN